MEAWTETRVLEALGQLEVIAGTLTVLAFTACAAFGWAACGIWLRSGIRWLGGSDRDS